MNRQDIAWLMVRGSGLCMLVLALQMLPALLLSLPDIHIIVLHWDLMKDAHLQELLSRGLVGHAAGIVTRTLIYLVAAGWLLCRGDRLIDLIANIR